MPKPHLVQALCPLRHCMMALAYEPGGRDNKGLNLILTPETASKLVAEALDYLIEQKVLKPWCDLCRAPRDRWTFEDAPLAFDTLEEAQPFLKQAEEEQQRAREMFKGSKN